MNYNKILSDKFKDLDTIANNNIKVYKENLPFPHISISIFLMKTF